MSSKTLRKTSLAIACLTMTLPLAAQPVAVSPGGAGDFAALAGSCPSFDWSGVADDQPVELAIYRVDQAGDLEPVVVEQLPAGARGWSPAADQCLDSGGRYAWMVRGQSAEGPGDWSEARLFQIAGLPSDEEVRQALETLRRYREGQEGDEDDLSRPGRAGDGGEGPTPSRGPDEGQLPTERARQASKSFSTPMDSDALTSRSVGDTPSPQAVTLPSSFSLNLSGDVNLGGFVFKEGFPLLHNSGGFTGGNTAVGLRALINVTPGSPHSYSGKDNSAFGSNALQANTSGSLNTAIGLRALGANTEGIANTAVGHRALDLNTVGDANTALGLRALKDNTTGSHNTAAGYLALTNNTTGFHNTAMGTYALLSNTGGDKNTAVGRDALYANTTGFRNVAVGYQALKSHTTGSRNTAVGYRAAEALTTGSFNTAVGRFAGNNWTTGSNNIAIGRGASGNSGDNGVIRIGGSNNQNYTFIEGISQAAGTFSTDVCISSTTDRLGPCSASSARFKQDVKPLADLHDHLSDLRPVSFRYKEEFAGHENPEIQYGFIAEEVARIFPSLVTTDDEGRPHTVRYDLLTPLLLREAQRQDGKVAELRRLLAQREREHEQAIADLEKRLDRLAKKKRFRR